MTKIKQTYHWSAGFGIAGVGVGVIVVALGGLLGYTVITQYERYSAERKEAAEEKQKTDDVAFVKQRIDTYVKSVYFENTNEMVERNDRPGASRILAASATGNLKERLEKDDNYGQDGVICTPSIESLSELSYEVEKSDDNGSQIAVRGTGPTATWDVALVSLTRNNDSRQMSDIECVMKIGYDEIGTTAEGFKDAMEATRPKNTP